MACALIMGLVVPHSRPTNQKLDTAGSLAANRKPKVCYQVQWIEKRRVAKQTSNPEP
jgi:hypothetical protein